MFKIDSNNEDGKFVDILGYEGHYGINRKGEIWSYYKEKILKPWDNKYGYYTVGLSKNGKCHKIKVHRLVALIFIPNPENKQEVNHKDTNKKNNHVNNLEWVTKSENMKHAFKNGLTKNTININHNNKAIAVTRKLSFNEAEEIRNISKTQQYSQSQLSRLYNVSQSTINYIIQGKRYRKEYY